MISFIKIMKIILALALILVVANSTLPPLLWSQWNSTNPVWSSNQTSTYPDPSAFGFVRNGPNSGHPYTQIFNNFSLMVNQYMYWEYDNPNHVLFCAAKYYLYSETLCVRDPHYLGSNYD